MASAGHDQGTNGNESGGTGAGDPLAGVTARDEELPTAEATETGTPAAGAVDDS